MGLYLKSVFMLIKSEMEYKASFISTTIGSSLATLFSILSTVFLLQKFGSVRRMDD